MIQFFKDMNPIEREIALLEIVQGSILLEGMHETSEELEERVVELKKKQYLSVNSQSMAQKDRLMKRSL